MRPSVVVLGLLILFYNIGGLRVLDVGCGPGLYVEEFRKEGVDAYGVDPDHNLAETFYIRRVSVFSDEYDRMYGKGFDVVMSLEVGEHIPQQLSLEFAKKLVLATKNNRSFIIFSAAHPGQGGDGHINAKPKDYWRNLFHFLNWREQKNTTEELFGVVRKGIYMGWLAQNVMVLRPVSESFGDRNYLKMTEEERPQARSIALFLSRHLAKYTNQSMHINKEEVKGDLTVDR
eukprot:gb/GEZN01014724.1/.p1 GENE.gb/GEZN01014724.1/~~gb/GEZN01014724.1/.p1  ORF type:complete len:231 (+),score=16.72 gb/GEZN01014724.1/:54-746(+)